MLVLGDALAMVLLEARGFGKDEFAALHPGGALGRTLLTRVTDIMRTGADMAVVEPGSSIGEALDVMCRARAGAVVVAENGGPLQGIFTQGDFARAFQKGPADISDRTVGELMTPNPFRSPTTSWPPKPSVSWRNTGSTIWWWSAKTTGLSG